MKRLVFALAILATGIWASSALAQTHLNYHSGTLLICSDCHTAHASQSHDNEDSRGAPFTNSTNLGTNGTTHLHLLRGEVNDLCLSCHNGSSGAPDVLGANTGKYSSELREAGGLNETTDDATTQGHGHTLGWTGTIPGSDNSTAPTSLAGTDGLECTMCHAQHGSNTQYRNLMNRSADVLGAAKPINFTGKNVTFEVVASASAATNTKDVAVISPTMSADVTNSVHDFNQKDIQFEEPDQTKSAYGAWCSTCHTNFHGAPGSTQVGSIAGGRVQSGGQGYLRHPTAGVNIGGSTTDSLTFVTSLANYRSTAALSPLGAGNVAKVMDANHLWTGDATTDKTISPSCFSCHKAHGNNNPFGLIFMGGASSGAVTAATEEGDGGSFRSTCHQCHAQGKDPARTF
ncbi:MAG TPA: hypothetical protein VI504_08265 [Candidatus Eisenbacteria bacterium]|jgi:cytochrome c5